MKAPRLSTGSKLGIFGRFHGWLFASNSTETEQVGKTCSARLELRWRLACPGANQTHDLGSRELIVHASIGARRHNSVIGTELLNLPVELNRSACAGANPVATFSIARQVVCLRVEP
jgi:hypothetical protein